MLPVLLADLRSISQKVESSLRGIWVSVKACWGGGWGERKRRNLSNGRNASTPGFHGCCVQHRCSRRKYLFRVHIILYRSLQLDAFSLLQRHSFLLKWQKSWVAELIKCDGKVQSGKSALSERESGLSCLLQISSREARNEVRKCDIRGVLENKLPKQMVLGAEGRNQQKLLILHHTQSRAGRSHGANLPTQSWHRQNKHMQRGWAKPHRNPFNKWYHMYIHSSY